jgi:hypothetical protein
MTTWRHVLSGGRAGGRSGRGVVAARTAPRSSNSSAAGTFPVRAAMCSGDHCCTSGSPPSSPSLSVTEMVPLTLAAPAPSSCCICSRSPMAVASPSASCAAAASCPRVRRAVASASLSSTRAIKPSGQRSTANG